jgi:hypothetical protein
LAGGRVGCAARKTLVWRGFCWLCSLGFAKRALSSRFYDTLNVVVQYTIDLGLFPSNYAKVFYTITEKDAVRTAEGKIRLFFLLIAFSKCFVR